MTKAERSALSLYKTTGYREINRFLRDDKYTPSVLDIEKCVQTIEDIDLSLSRMRLPETIAVYRSYNPSWLPKVVDDAVGDIFEEDSYSSTSLVKSVAESFALANPLTTYLAEIVVPGGSNVGAFAGAPDLIVNVFEFEILLPRNTRSLVNHIDRPDESQGYGTIQMEVIT